MAFFFSKQSKQPKTAHLNWMSGVSYDITDPIVRLRLSSSTCFFGEPMYYHHAVHTATTRSNRTTILTADALAYLRQTLDAVSPAKWRDMSPAALLEKTIDDALRHDAEKTLEEAVRLRQIEHIRTTPQVILVRAAHQSNVRGTGLVRKYAHRIIMRADEPAVGLAYQLYRFGKPVPNALKRAWRDALQQYDDYQLAKYRMENKAVKTVDVVNLVHPKSKAVDKLANEALTVNNQTWEAIVSKRGNNKVAWKKAIPKMGHMALLRNLRNLCGAEVPQEMFVPKLVKTVQTGKQLPFRYYSAYRMIENVAPPKVLDAVEECLTLSIGRMPRFKGRTMALCDNSGSAQGTTTSSLGTMKMSTIANMQGTLAGMCSDEGYLGVFGDRLERIAVRKSASVFDHVDRAERLARSIGQATENGIWLFFDQAIKKRERWDTVFVFSDMQAGHGGLYGIDPDVYKPYQWRGGRYIDVAKLIRDYRQLVNPKVHVFLVQIAGYKDTLVPEFYNRTYILGGWGEGLLRFAAQMIDGR